MYICTVRYEQESETVQMSWKEASLSRRFWAQQDLVGLLREEPRWTSGLLRRWQQLHFTNLKRFSRFGAPTTERLGGDPYLSFLCSLVIAFPGPFFST